MVKYYSAIVYLKLIKVFWQLNYYYTDDDNNHNNRNHKVIDKYSLKWKKSDL